MEVNKVLFYLLSVISSIKVSGALAFCHLGTFKNILLKYAKIRKKSDFFNGIKFKHTVAGRVKT